MSTAGDPVAPAPSADAARRATPAAESAAATSSYAIWRRLHGPTGAMAITALASDARESALYAAAVVGLGNQVNAGRVFQTTDHGATWESLAPFENCWSVTSILRTPSGAVLAGGLSWDGSQASGIVYRSQDNGATWTPALVFPNGAIYRLVWTGGATIWAVTGWEGRLYQSLDDGQTWTTAVSLGSGTTVHAFVHLRNDLLVAAVESSTGGHVLRSADGGKTWGEGTGLDGVSAVYVLYELGDRLYAGVRAGERGGICTADLQGAAWTCMFELPGGGLRSVRAFANGESGELFAGGESTVGRLTTDVLVKSVGADWQVFGGEIDDANAVYTLAAAGDSLFAGAGIYGGVYKIALPVTTNRSPIYLPLIGR